MFALFFVLNRKELLPEIMAELQKVDVQGVTVLDGLGVGKPTVHYEGGPRIGGLLHTILERQQHNKVIFSIIRTEKTLQDAIHRIDKVVGGLQEHQHGILFTFKLHSIHGGFR